MRWLVALALLWTVSVRADERWDEYQLLMWQDLTPAQMGGLKTLGFTGTKLRAGQGVVDAEGKASRVTAGLPFYLENLATDFYSPYHRYTEGKSVTWLFDAAKTAYRAGDPAAFMRQPGLSDPAWLARIRSRMADVVRAEGAGRPLFYNLGDEPGIGDLAAAWDADMAPESLRGMREWLRTQYADLAGLNRQWGTGFTTWEEVLPETTDAAIRRTDENFSAWSDFKAWMDVAFSRAVRTGTEALHAADPAALAALEGGQVPGWGGYDYALLAPAVNVMEIYDFGNALDLALAANPRLIPLRTSFMRGPREVHAAWRSLLHGGRGTVVWDEANDVVQPDGTPGPRGREIAALMATIRPVAAVLRRMQPDPDPVAVLYSQGSFRVRWLLDRRAGDHDWAARDAEREYDDNPVRASRRVLLQRLAELAVQPRLVTGGDLDGLAQSGVKVLFLPHAIALSDAEVSAIAAFRAAGGTVLADTEPALFDGHGRRRIAPPLADVPRPEAVRPLGTETEPAILDALVQLLTSAGAPPRLVMRAPDGERATGVETRWFRDGHRVVFGLQSGRPWGAPAQVTVRLARVPGVTDVRQPGRAVDAVVELDGIEPRILSFSTR